jgi:uncharacterized protein
MNASTFDPKDRGNMAPEEYDIAMKLCERDPEFKQLWDEHRELKTRLSELQAKTHLSTDEEIEVKRIKRVKLAGKDRIAEKIRDFKVGVIPD